MKARSTVFALGLCLIPIGSSLAYHNYLMHPQCPGIDIRVSWRDYLSGKTPPGNPPDAQL
jgi:hypothetical protein